MTDGADQTASASKASLWRFAPIVVFAVIGVFFARQLYDPPSSTLESVLLDRPAPEFSMPSLREDEPPVTDAALREGQVSVVNLWASWCVPCRVEHPHLVTLSERDDIQMLGIAYRDEPDASHAFLAELGDPFDRIGADELGRESLKWGVEGVPETFIVSGDGRVVYKHTGPIQNDDLTVKILPAIEAAQALATN